MKLKDVQQFFENRPSLSKRSIAKEVGISRQYLNYILNEQRPLTDGTIKKLEPILAKYGFQESEPEYKRLQQLDYRAQIRDEAHKQGAPTDKPYKPPKDGSRGDGLKKAHEAINTLKEINPKDESKDAGYDTVICWIETNR